MKIFRPSKHTIVLLVFAVLKVASVFAQSTIKVPADAPTIQAGINLATNGDTVLVAPGTYNENINFDGKSITVTSGATSYAGATATVINATGDGPVVTFDTGENSTATLNGFTIQGGHKAPATCSFGGGVYMNGASPTVSNNTILNNMSYGIYVEGSSSPLIEGNDIKGTHYSTISLTSCHSTTGFLGGGRGITLMDAISPQIVGNIIEDNVMQTKDTNNSPTNGSGLLIEGTQQLLLKNNIIRNNIADYEGAISGQIGNMVLKSLVMVQNLIYGNSLTDDQVYISGTYQSGMRPVLTEINNTIYGTGQLLVFSFGPSTIDNNIFENAFADSGGPGSDGGLVCADPESVNSPLTIQNNDNFAPGISSQSNCRTGTGNISEDPVFVNPTNEDFHEQADSPTITTGNLNAPDFPNADLDNKARIVCGATDMGAYELHPHPPISLSSSRNPAPGGSTINFTAQLTGNCNTPTGTVQYFEDGNPLGTASLDPSGVATLTTSMLVVGQHSLTAKYPGDFNFDDSSSNTLLQTITGDPTTTSLTVTPNPAAAFYPITLSSSVASPYGTPTGTVTFTSGTSTLATVALNNGVATTTIASLGAGSYNIVAHYTADTRFHASTSAAVQEKVVSATSITSISASPDPVYANQPLTLSASVRAVYGTNLPTGQVAFYAGSVLLGYSALNAAGTATMTTSNLTAGTHAITARYGGSSNFDLSEATLSEAVTLIGTSLGLTATPNPANAGQTVTLTATATASLSGMVPFGMVAFYDGGTSLGTADLGGNGTATFTTTSLAAGTHHLSATIPAGAYYAGSSSPQVDELIQSYDFGLKLSKHTVSIPSGDYTNITATVSPVGGFHGTVSLSCSGVPDYALCSFPQGNTVSLANGMKTITLSINTSDVNGYGQLVSRLSPPANGGTQLRYLAGLLLPGFILIGLKRRSFTHGRLRLILCCALFTTGLFCLQACGSKQPGKTAPGTYSLSILASSTNSPTLKQSVPLQLIVTR